jgi:hypothetical protein
MAANQGNKQGSSNTRGGSNDKESKAGSPSEKIKRMIKTHQLVVVLLEAMTSLANRVQRKANS